MSFNYYRKLPSFNTVAAGATCTLQLPRGAVYKTIVLRHTAGGAAPNQATTGANLARIRLKINGVTRRDISGARQLTLNDYYLVPFVNGQIIIPFTRPWMKTIEAEENLGMGTRNVDTLTIEVDIAGGVATPTLEAYALMSPEDRDLGTVVEVQELTFSTAVSGQFEIATLPKGNGALAALHLFNSNITDVVLRMNSINVIESLNGLHSVYDYHERAPQSGIVHLDALFQNRLGDAFPINALQVQDLRLIPTLSAAGSVPIVMETLNQPLGAPRV